MSGGGPRRGGVGNGVRALVGVIGEVFITVGVLTLLFIAWQLWWTDVEADQQQAGEVDALVKSFSASAPKGTKGKSPAVSKAPPVGTGFAVVYVPRWGIDYRRPVVQGTGHDDLKLGIGHKPDAAMPGKIGNFATAGHRTTYGKPYARINELQPGDPIVVQTREGWSIYTMRKFDIVPPNRGDLLAPVPGKPGQKPTQAWMTMVACHPPYSARERYIVYALLDRTTPASAGIPPELKGGS